MYQYSSETSAEGKCHHQPTCNHWLGSGPVNVLKHQCGKLCMASDRQTV